MRSDADIIGLRLKRAPCAVRLEQLTLFYIIVSSCACWSLSVCWGGSHRTITTPSYITTLQQSSEEEKGKKRTVK